MNLEQAEYLRDVLKLPDHSRVKYLEALENYIYYMSEITRILTQNIDMMAAVPTADTKIN